MLIVVAALIARWPRVAALPVAFVVAWLALSLLLKASKLHRLGRAQSTAARPAAAKAPLVGEQTKT